MEPISGVAASLVPGTLAGIYITVNLSAVNRLVINTGRPIIVWIVSLALQWQDFKILQFIGFLIMIIGVFTFGDVLHFGMHSTCGSVKALFQDFLKILGSASQRMIDICDFRMKEVFRSDSEDVEILLPIYDSQAHRYGSMRSVA